MKRRIHKPAATLARTLILGMSIMLSCNVLAKDYATTDALAAEASARQAADTNLQNQINNIPLPAQYVIGDTLSDSSIVFYVDGSGEHGLAAWPTDITAIDWYKAGVAAQALGVGFRLPTKYELNLLYLQKVANVVGGFADEEYWSSTESEADGAWTQDFTTGHTGNQGLRFKYENFSNIRISERAIRTF